MLRNVKIVLHFDCACECRQIRTVLKNDNRCEGEEAAADGSRFLFSSKYLIQQLKRPDVRMCLV